MGSGIMRSTSASIFSSSRLINGMPRMYASRRNKSSSLILPEETSTSPSFLPVRSASLSAAVISSLLMSSESTRNALSCCGSTLSGIVLCDGIFNLLEHLLEAVVCFDEIGGGASVEYALYLLWSFKVGEHDYRDMLGSLVLFELFEHLKAIFALHDKI